MKILDFGAGWRAFHTIKLRAMGLEVTATDFGRNFDPGLHLAKSLLGRYDVVMASNVVNVHGFRHGLKRTIAEIARYTASPGGFAVVNYPESPRKLPQCGTSEIAGLLGEFFNEVDRIPRKSCPLWVCKGPRYLSVNMWLESNPDFTPEEMDCANIRPVGAVGANALVPRFVLELLGQSLNQ